MLVLLSPREVSVNLYSGNSCLADNMRENFRFTIIRVSSERVNFEIGKKLCQTPRSERWCHCNEKSHINSKFQISVVHLSHVLF